MLKLQEEVLSQQQELIPTSNAANNWKLPVPPSQGSGFESMEELVVHSTLRTIDERIQTFGLMDDTASELEQWVSVSSVSFCNP